MLAATFGTAYTLAGRVTDAVPLLTQAMEQALARERWIFTRSVVFPWGKRRWWLATSRRRRPSLSGLWRMPVNTRNGGNEAYALHLLGEIAARRSLPEAEQAEASYRQALTLADELGMRPLQAHCHRGLGTLYTATGQREQAHTELSTAIEMYTSMEMRFWLPETEMALAQVVEGR